MKKLFTLLSVAAISVAFGQKATLQSVPVVEGLPTVAAAPTAQRAAADYTLVQYNDGNTFSTSTPLCADAVNHNSRFFNLSDYGITTDFEVTAINFAASSTGITVWGEVATVAAGTDITAEEILPESLTVTEAYASTTVPSQNSAWVNMPFLETAVIPGGTSFGVAVGYEWITDGERAWFGNNTLGETAPSYIGWPASECVEEWPVAVSAVGFPVSWLLNVEGSTAELGTVELGSSKLAVYPNPATTEVNITLEGSKIAQVDVADVTGRVVSSQAVKSGKVNVANLSSGVYFLRVKDDKGVTRIQKFIKK